MMKFFIICLTLFVSPLMAMEVVELQTKKGIKVWFVEDKSSPIISMEAVFKDSGAVQDEDSKIGLSMFATALMNQGTKTLDYKSLERKKEELSIKALGVIADTDHIVVSLQTLSRSKDESFALLKETLKNPRFEDLQMETLRTQIISGIQDEERNPSSIASIERLKMLFAGHPYGRRNQGTQESIRNIKKEDLLNFAASRFSTDRLVVGICGNLTQDEVIMLVDSVFDDLPSSSVLKETPQATVSVNGTNQNIPWDIPQTIVKFADYGISQKDPDNYPAMILFSLLGGGTLENRLMQEIRVKQGLTYGIRVEQMHFDKADALIGGFASDTEKAPKALKSVKEIWTELKKNGPTEIEIEKAKDFLTNSYVHRFTETSQIAAYLVGTQLLGFPSDYFKKRNDLIRAVKLEDVKRVGDKLLNPDKLSFVVVGKKS